MDYRSPAVIIIRACCMDLVDEYRRLCIACPTAGLYTLYTALGLGLRRVHVPRCVASDRNPRHPHLGMCVSRSSLGGRECPGLDCAVVASNFTTSSAGTRPTALTSMPCVLAHSRPQWCPPRCPGALRSPRPGSPGIPACPVAPCPAACSRRRADLLPQEAPRLLQGHARPGHETVTCLGRVRRRGV